MGQFLDGFFYILPGLHFDLKSWRNEVEESLTWLLKQRAVEERALESLPLLDSCSSLRFSFILGLL